MIESMLHSTCEYCGTTNIISRLHAGAINCTKCGAALKPPIKTNPSISGEPYHTYNLTYDPRMMVMCSTDGYVESSCDSAMPFHLNH